MEFTIKRPDPNGVSPMQLVVQTGGEQATKGALGIGGALFHPGGDVENHQNAIGGKLVGWGPRGRSLRKAG